MYYVKLPQQIDMQFLVNYEAEFIIFGGMLWFLGRWSHRTDP